MAKQNCRCYSNSNNRLAWVTPAPHRPAQRVFQFLILIFHSLHSLSFPPSLSLSLTLHIFRYESELNLNLIELELRCRILLLPEKRETAALRSLAAEDLTGDGAVGMRGLPVFISDIRNCQNKEHERLRVDKEHGNIRTRFKTEKVRVSLSHFLTSRNVRLIFLAMSDAELELEFPSL